MVTIRTAVPSSLLAYWDNETQALNLVGDFDVLEWIELLATAPNAKIYGGRIAWFLWDLAASSTCRQLTTGTYPGQAKRPPTPPQPCCCKYHPSASVRGFVFSIDPMCTHHGSNLVRYSAQLGLTIERWQAELYEASVRNGIPIQFTTRRGRRW